jgi:hypothetical protein
MKHKKLPLGFTFSFPVRHEDIDKVGQAEGRVDDWVDMYPRGTMSHAAFKCSLFLTPCWERAHTQKGKEGDSNCDLSLPI